MINGSLSACNYFLEQSSTLKPLGRKSCALSEIACWAGKNNIVRIMPRVVISAANRNDMFKMKDVPAFDFLELGVPTSGIITPVFLRFKLGLYLLRSKRTLRVLLDSAASVAFHSRYQISMLCSVILSIIRPSFVSYFVFVCLIPYLVACTSVLLVRLSIDFIVSSYSFSIKRSSLSLLCINLLFVDSVIASRTCINSFFILLIVPSPDSLSFFALAIAPFTASYLFFMLLSIHPVFQEYFLFLDTIPMTIKCFYLFLVFPSILSMLFFMGVVIDFTVSVHADFAYPQESIRSASVNGKVAVCSRRYLLALRALLHPFWDNLFYNNGLPILASLTRRVPPIFLLRVFGVVRTVGREPLLAFKALLKCWRILRFNGSVGDRLNGLVAECVKIECALIGVMVYTLRHNEKSSFLLSRSGMLVASLGLNNILPLVYHEPASEASLSHFFAPQFALLGGELI